MKKIALFLCITLIYASSCSKDDSNEQSGCSNTFDLLVDKDWFPPEEDSDIFAIMRFNSDGDYSENGTYDGTWELESDCTTIHFYVADSGGLEFQFEIISISSNSFKVKGPFGAILTYHN